MRTEEIKKEIGGLHTHLNYVSNQLAQIGEKIKQSQPEYKEGEWLYFNECNTERIVRFSSVEGYQLCDGVVDTYPFWRNINWDDLKYYRKATPSQIERILIKVAEYKGFINGVKTDRTPIEKHYSNIYPVIYPLRYIYEKDSLVGDDMLYVYCEGKWATIIKEPTEVEKFIGYVNGVYNSISFGKKSGCGCVSMYCESLSNLYEKYINEPKRF